VFINPDLNSHLSQT